MTARVLNSDNSVTDIPVRWHAATDTAPAGLWTTISAIRAKYEAVNRRRASYGVQERDIEHVVDDICAGEADIEVYADSASPEPYRHFGLLRRTIRRGGTDDFWNNHA